MPRGSAGRKKEIHRFEQWRTPKAREEGGVVRISGTFLLDHESDILNLVKHEGKLAEERGAAHRVTKIEKADGGIIVETSEHNLALRIGKALVSAYKGDHTYKFPRGEKFVEVDWRRD
ncbi:hypothetical protein HZB08_02250 [Candidatus Saganbacteria bacterium]|uniref:Uncharacterized protein n=1 Tax=Candidatus Saganbacteria bacterium TaxID=2575572 RepID=A0A9D6UMS5_UNCSA|nr:hypothetical protein [Candidatus Saganbacteria bacterium]